MKEYLPPEQFELPKSIEEMSKIELEQEFWFDVIYATIKNCETTNKASYTTQPSGDMQEIYHYLENDFREQDVNILDFGYVINGKTHQHLRQIVRDLKIVFLPENTIVENLSSVDWYINGLRSRLPKEHLVSAVLNQKFPPSFAKKYRQGHFINPQKYVRMRARLNQLNNQIQVPAVA